MKKTMEIRISSKGRLLAVLALGMTLLVGTLPAQAATVADLLKFMPADAQAAVGIPDIAEVEKAGAPMLMLPMLSELSTLAVQLGGDTLAEGLTNSGINANAPGAAFVKSATGSDVDGCGILMVADADKVRETMISLVGGEGSAIALPGDLEGRLAPGGDVAYAIAGDKLFVASNEALLKQLAERISAPAEVNYGKGGPKDEVVLFSRLDIIEQSNLMSTIPPLAMVKPLMDTIKPFSDEVILAIGEDAGKAYLRVAARDTGNASLAAPSPLTLHGFMDPSAPVVLNLRLTPELINAVSMALMNNPTTRQAGGIIRIAGAMLGEELAISFAGLKDGDIPDAVIAANVKEPASVPNLLRMLAKIEEPSYKLDETDVYVYPNVAEGTDLHIATAGATLVVAPGEEALKTAVGRFAGGTDGAGVNTAVVNRGTYGFVMLDGSKAAGLPLDMIPVNINLADVNLALTMGVEGEWRELVLTAPSGFDGIANILKDVM